MAISPSDWQTGLLQLLNLHNYRFQRMLAESVSFFWPQPLHMHLHVCQSLGRCGVEPFLRPSVCALPQLSSWYYVCAKMLRALWVKQNSLEIDVCASESVCAVIVWLRSKIGKRLTVLNYRPFACMLLTRCEIIKMLNHSLKWLKKSKFTIKKVKLKASKLFNR